MRRHDFTAKNAETAEESLPEFHSIFFSAILAVSAVKIRIELGLTKATEFRDATLLPPGFAMLYESESVRVTADRGVATCWLDFPGAVPNLLNSERLMTLDAALEAALQSPSIEVLVLRSAKLSGFCAGYDADALALIRTDDDAREVFNLHQRICDRLAAAECLTLAYIHGPCLGPGLALALACDYRLAVARPDSFLGLGDCPAASGGVTRLTRVVGSATTVDLLLKNELVTAREAVKLGLVDHAFCERRARIELRTFLDQQHRKPRRWRTLLDGWAARRVLGAYELAIENSPAMIAAAMPVIPVAAHSESHGLVAEQIAFTSSILSEAGRASSSLLQTQQLLTRKVNVTPPRFCVVGPVEPVAVLLSEAVIRGGSVVLVPSDSETTDDSLLNAAIVAAQHRGRLTPLEAEQCCKRIGTESDRRPDAVILTLETAVGLEAAEAVAGPGTPILTLADRRTTAKYATQPQRLFGITINHNLVEISRGANCDSRALDKAIRVFGTLGLTPLVVSDRRGSIVQRVQAAYWDEAVGLVSDGVPIATVDAAARSLGVKFGPLETLDGLGLASVAKWVPRVKPLLDAGIEGRPANEGFYLLEADNPTGPNAAAQMVLLQATAPQIEFAVNPFSEVNSREGRHLARERLLMRVINATAAVLAEDANVGPAEVDFAIVTGVGLLAETGGPLRHAEALGLRTCAEQLRTLAHQFGERYKPHPEITRRVLAGEAFYDVGQHASRPLRMSA